MAKKIGLVVDMQTDFITPIGALYVNGAEKIVYDVGKIISNMDGVVFTVDWHTFNHCSFKENGGLWERHCVQFTTGASLPDYFLSLTKEKPVTFLEKGTHPYVEEYGAFESYENCGELAKWLGYNFGGEKEIDVYVCGVAGDYCVIDTVKSFMCVKPKQIRDVFVIKDLCPCIDTSFDLDAACKECGAQTVMSNEIVIE